MVVVSAWRVIAVIGVFSVLGACSDTSSNQSEPIPSTPGTETTSQTPSGEPTEPGYEPTAPETAQPTRKQPSIHLTGAPIGPGVPVNQPADEAKQCAGVSLTDLELRNGTTLTFDPPTVSDESIFTIDQSGCGDQSPSCSGYSLRPDGDNGCFVGVRQLTKRKGEHVTLIIPATAICATDEDCKSLEGHGASEIGFDSRDLGSTTPTDSPSTEPSESPEESPSETPTETPTETPSSDG